MTVARKGLVDASVTPYYHCISRCVRKAFLCGDHVAHRKGWIAERLQELSAIFAINVCGYSIMDNHLHVLLRLDVSTAAALSDVEIAERWLTLCPPRGLRGARIPVTPEMISTAAANVEWVAECRRRLGDLGWFMKCLKEPISRRANKEENCTGAFWEGRFKSIAILDEASLLATCAYIDLNPVAAHVAATPEASEHTSLRSRIDHCEKHRMLTALKEGHRYVSGDKDLEQGHWLFPIEDKRDPNGQGRAGLLHGITLTGYLQLVDWSSRLIRPGKASVSRHATALLDRLNIDAASWQQTLEKLFQSQKSIGVYFGHTTRLYDVAHQQGRRFLKNLTGRDFSLEKTTTTAAIPTITTS